MRYSSERAHHEDTQRLEAFSDGVFAIAITLLVLEIGVPEVHDGESLGRALLRLWPSYFGYAVSFVTIGIMWANHHTMFKDIDRHDHTLTVLNLLLLMCIAFIPFPTAVVAEYMRSDEHQLEATVLLGATFTVTAVFFGAVWFYASAGRRLIDEHVSDQRVRQRNRRYLPGTPMYAITIPLAFVSVWISLAIIGGLALFYLLPISSE
jgi:uncharacterized membrane protein